MALKQEQLDEIRKTLKKELTEALNEAGDVVEKVSEAHALLQNEPPETIAGLMADVLFESVKLPWYIPQFIARGAVVSEIVKFVVARSKKNG